MYTLVKEVLRVNYKMKSKRVLLGLSQEDLAKSIGVSRQTIILIEKEKYNPSLKLCIAICKTLNTTLDELFWEDEESER
jgi:putative transcriptional regulator